MDGWMFVCVYVHMTLYVCGYAVCMFVHMHVCMYACTYVRMYIWMYASMHVCMNNFNQMEQHGSQKGATGCYP